MLLRSLFGVERAEVAALAGLGILLARIETILAGFEFSDHLNLPLFVVRHSKVPLDLKSKSDRTSREFSVQPSAKEPDCLNELASPILPSNDRFKCPVDQRCQR